MNFDIIWEGLIVGILILVVLSFLFGMFCFWVLPILWAWIKPIIHAVTA